MLYRSTIIQNCRSWRHGLQLSSICLHFEICSVCCVPCIAILRNGIAHVHLYAKSNKIDMTHHHVSQSTHSAHLRAFRLKKSFTSERQSAQCNPSSTAHASHIYGCA